MTMLFLLIRGVILFFTIGISTRLVQNLMIKESIKDTGIMIAFLVTIFWVLGQIRN